MHRYIAETKFGFFEIAESDGRIKKIAFCDGRDYKINETPSILAATGTEKSTIS